MDEISGKLMEQIGRMQEAEKKETDHSKKLKIASMEKLLYDVRIREFQAEENAYHNDEMRRIQETKNKAEIALMTRKQNKELELKEKELKLKESKQEEELKLLREKQEQEAKFQQIKIEIEKFENKRKRRLDLIRMGIQGGVSLASGLAYTIATVQTYKYNAEGNIEPRTNGDRIGSTFGKIMRF